MENPPSALSVNEYEEDWSQFASNKYAEMAARDPLSPKGMKAHPSQDQVVRRFTKLEEEISGAMVEPYRSVGEKSYVTPLCALRSEYEVPTHNLSCVHGTAWRTCHSFGRWEKLETHNLRPTQRWLRYRF